MTSPERAAIDALWSEHGGRVHGPRVETVTMPQEDFYGFVDDVIRLAQNGGKPQQSALPDIHDDTPSLDTSFHDHEMDV